MPQAVKTFHFTWPDVIGETEYRLLESPDGVAPLVVVATLAANATSHDLLVPLFRRLGAQYVLRACNGATCRDSQPVTVTGTLAGAVGYLQASNNGSGLFGWSVALSADGTTLAVGARGERSNATGVGGDQNDTSAPSSGAVYIFSRAGSGWTQQEYIKASNAEAADRFGWSVALSADGNTLAVGAISEASTATGVGGNQADNSAFECGAVYVFSRSGAAWSQQAYVKASNTGDGDNFGDFIALSGDGNTLAVGVPNEASNATGVGGTEADNSAGFSGAIYVFTRNGTAWSQQAYVKASNTGADDRFGNSVALSANGNTLAVGAPFEDSNASGIGGNQNDNSASSSGAVYLFSRSGTAWSQHAYVKASNAGVGDGFGSSVALSADGNMLAVGARGEASSATGIGGNQADNSASGAGAVYVFSRGGGSWAQQAYVKASNTEASDEFGFSVALSADGNTLAVGAVGEDSSTFGLASSHPDNSAIQSGAVYVFSRSGAAWSHQAHVKASNTAAGDVFGRFVGLSADGTTLATGAYYQASGDGAVYVY